VSGRRTVRLCRGQTKEIFYCQRLAYILFKDFRVKLISQRTVLQFLYGLPQAFFIEGDPHSYTRHIERVARGERDITPSAQD
jgi:hypothetical protein